MKNSIELPEKKTIRVSNFKTMGAKLQHRDTDTTSLTISITSSHLFKN